MVSFQKHFHLPWVTECVPKAKEFLWKSVPHVLDKGELILTLPSFIIKEFLLTEFVLLRDLIVVLQNLYFYEHASNEEKNIWSKGYCLVRDQIYRVEKPRNL